MRVGSRGVVTEFLLLTCFNVGVSTLNLDDENSKDHRSLQTMVGATFGSPGFAGYSVRDCDLGVRFSKIYFDKETQYEAAETNNLTLSIQDYPLDMEMATLLRKSQCVSVVIYEDCDECDIYTEELVQAIGGYPIHVSSKVDSPFWDEFREVIRVQQQRITGVDPSLTMPLPKIWAGTDTLTEIANHVHDELPGSHHAALIEQLIGEGLRVDRNVIPSSSKVEFLRGVVMLCNINAWAISEVGPYNFAAKYHVGRARPEEVAWMIATDQLTTGDGVPGDVVNAIKSLELESQFNFTAYPEGSPTHPSWPAMHSAASSASLWLSVVLNLTEEQMCEIKLVDWAVSYGRTVAGVHFPTDNVDGLNFGQEIVARKLAEHLVNTYKSDAEAVDKKIADMRFDWRNFTESACYMNAMGITR